MTATKKKLMTLTEAIRANAYSPEHKDSLPQRAAHFLDWAAARYPKQYVPYNLLLKAVLGTSTTPSLHSSDVEQMRGRMSRVRVILQRKYARDLDSMPGVGARATVDDADTLVTSMPKRVASLRRAKTAVATTASLIDPAKIPNTADMAPWKRWMNASVGDVLRTLNSPEFEKKLLPPSPRDEGGGTE